VFTGLFDLKEPGEYPYLVVEESGEGAILRGRPPAELVRHEVSYEELPEGARRRVLEAYRGMWGLRG
jgi:hypothetical protein